MAMVNVLVMILVVCVVLGLIYWVIGMLPLPEPFKQIVQVCTVVIGVLIVVLMLLALIGIGPGVRLGARALGAMVAIAA